MSKKIDLNECINTIINIPERRSEHIFYLASNREYVSNIGKILWETPGFVQVLLNEILSTYPYLSSMVSLPPNSQSIVPKFFSIRICNVLSLLQVFPSNESVIDPFISTNIPMYLLPFLHINNRNEIFENLKLAALCSIAHICKSELPHAILYLIDNDFIPLCLRILKFGNAINKTVSAYILMKIFTLSDPNAECFRSEGNIMSLLTVFNQIIDEITNLPNSHISKNLVTAYNAIIQKSAISKNLIKRFKDTLLKLSLAKVSDDKPLVSLITLLKGVCSENC